MKAAPAAVERIVGRIQTIHGLRVLFDADLLARSGASDAAKRAYERAIGRKSESAARRGICRSGAPPL